MCSSVLVFFKISVLIAETLYCKPETILSLVQSNVDKTSLNTYKCMHIYVIIMDIVTHLLLSYFKNDTVRWHGCVLFTLV